MIKNLDLHGVKHEDARTQTIHFVEDNWDTEHELEIITGCSEKMIHLVCKVLEEYRLNYQIGRMNDLNKSRVIVFM